MQRLIKRIQISRRRSGSSNIPTAVYHCRQQIGDGDSRDASDDDNKDDGEGEEEEEEDELDELHDLSDEGGRGAAAQGGAAPTSLWGGKHQGGQEEDAQPPPKTGTEDETATPTDLGKGGRGGGDGEKTAGKEEHTGTRTVAGGDAAAAVGVGAPAGGETGNDPELPSSSREQHEEMESGSAATLGETNRDEVVEHQLRDDQEQQRGPLESKQVAAAAGRAAGAVGMPTGGNDAAELATDGGIEADAGGDLPLDNGAGGADAEDDEHGDGGGKENGRTGAKDVETAHEAVVPGGHPVETISTAFRGKKPEGVATALPAPPPAGGTGDTADARTASNGAAAAMRCQWLPIKLPPPLTSSPAGGGDAVQDAIDQPSPVLQGKGAPPPVAEVETLESPQDGALLKRKADRDPPRGGE